MHSPHERRDYSDERTEYHDDRREFHDETENFTGDGPPKKKQKRNKPTLSCHECVERKTKVNYGRSKRNNQKLIVVLV